jgi:hypothetical protein
VFLAGQVDFRVIAAAIFRTDLIHNRDALAKIDAELAARAPSWNKLSREKVTELVDWMVIELDPDAVRVARQCDLDRHLEVGPGQNGMAEVWGEVRGPDAAAFDAKLNELAATVCPAGWTEIQLPDGTIVWTSPRGRTYTTTPTGARFFPQLATPTGTLVHPNSPPPKPNRELAMPKRKRTRAQDRAYRVERERALNRARYAADPPPF